MSFFPPMNLFFLTILFLMTNQLQAVDEKPKLKILVLIIASDRFPGSDLSFPYKEMQQIWRSYMHLDPEHIEAYFIQANPALPSTSEIKGDVIWSKIEENVIPGILNKTLLSLECLLPRLMEFDFVLRTNLSSFYVFPGLLEFVKSLPKRKCYCGSGEGFGSGSGVLLSIDLAKMLVNNKDKLWNSTSNDDVSIGWFLREKGISLIPAPRTDLLSLHEWNHYKKNSSLNAFHFRVKNILHERRFNEDMQIYAELFEKFYMSQMVKD